jgi:hypothetical protein
LILDSKFTPWTLEKSEVKARGLSLRLSALCSRSPGPGLKTPEVWTWNNLRFSHKQAPEFEGNEVSHRSSKRTHADARARVRVRARARGRARVPVRVPVRVRVRPVVDKVAEAESG